ncbi:MAG: SDR family oxidoreductase [Aureispira sp.]|nr:SDR family oxidoreductase [Aureispira sp.]
MNKKVLVLGASGTVGSAVATALSNKNYEVVVATRSTNRQLAHPSVLLDYQRPETFATALEGMDGLFIVMPNFANALVPAFHQLIDLAKEKKVQHIQFLSAIGADANPEGLHRRIELHIEASGIAYTFLRPNFFMQNFLTFDKPNLDKGVIFLPTGEGKCSYIDVRDIANVAATAFFNAEHSNKAYTLTGPKAISSAEIASIFSAALGKTIKNINPSEEEYVAALEAFGLPAEAIETNKTLYSVYIRNGYVAGIADDVEQVTGQAAVSFEEFAKTAI